MLYSYGKVVTLVKWTIKQMAEMSGIPMDSLRYYDKLGIISPERMENGYRHYNESDYIRLQYVTVMKYAQFSLSEIKTVIHSLRMEVNDECNRRNLDIFKSKRVELLEIVKNYKNIVKLIDNLLPMMNGFNAYHENEDQIEAFVRDIYKSITKDTESR